MFICLFEFQELELYSIKLLAQFDEQKIQQWNLIKGNKKNDFYFKTNTKNALSHSKRKKKTNDTNEILLSNFIFVVVLSIFIFFSSQPPHSVLFVHVKRITLTDANQSGRSSNSYSSISRKQQIFILSHTQNVNLIRIDLLCCL